MLRWSLLICGMVGIAACQNPAPTLEEKPADMHECPPPPDLTPIAARCAAAKGLGGDVLGGICLDMDKIDTQGLVSLGFDLTAYRGNCEGWESATGKFQPKSPSTTSGFMQCGFLLPNLPIETKYPRVTLALIHQANLPTTSQAARIELFDANPLRIWLSTAATVDQRTIVEIETTKIPGGPYFQPVSLLVANIGSAIPSWTITSIAVLGQTAQ